MILVLVASFMISVDTTAISVDKAASKLFFSATKMTKAGQLTSSGNDPMGWPDAIQSTLRCERPN